jgi:signal transduction histidine kinase
VNRVIRKNSKQLIAQKISIDVGNLDQTVLTDIKWTDFILQQLIDNAVKYQSTTSNKIEFRSEQRENNVLLIVRDHGVGIPEQDLSRVFDKGFTGENGRNFARSTGMGLYLCKTLCTKLGLNLAIQSQQGQYTEVTIIFPKCF